MLATFLLVVFFGSLIMAGMLWMAGGVAADIRAPYPKGEDALIPIKFGPFTMTASTAPDEIVEKFELPFACKPVKARLTAQTITQADTDKVTVNLQDDAGTEIVKDAVATAVVAGAGSWEALTLASGAANTQFNAGALLEMSYGASNAGDVGLDVTLVLYVRPVF